jgi:hypothetical protein
MGAINLLITSLKSGKIRELATQGQGVRTIAGPILVKTEKGNGLLNILGWVWNSISSAVVQIGGFLVNAIAGGFQWTWTALVQQLQSRLTFLWNFNWNATDTELDAQYASFLSVLTGQLGGTIGNAIGWLVCGAAPGLVMMKFNPLLAVRILNEVGEEACEELIGNLRLLVQQAANLAFQWQAINMFKAGRKAIKSILADPNGAPAKLFGSLFGKGSLAKVKQWGEKGSKPWSFAIALENWIESIGPQWLQNFTEELIEEFFDSCSEAFYVIAGAADQYAIEQKLNKASLLGQGEIVEITPNRDVPEEKIVLAGPQELIKPVIVQTMTQHQLLDNRDVGMWVGEPIREFVKSPPMTIQLRIIMSSKEATVVGAKRVQITIPAVNRAKLDWADIKTRVGGVNGYMWGRFKGIAKLTGGHKIELFASTDAEAVDRLTQLAWLSDEEILGVTVTEEKREGARKTIDALYKQPTRIYPYGMTIINQRKVLNEESGLAQLSGTYKRKKTSLIPLYVDTRPDDFSEVIAELFRVPGPNG